MNTKELLLALADTKNWVQNTEQLSEWEAVVTSTYKLNQIVVVAVLDNDDTELSMLFPLGKGPTTAKEIKEFDDTLCDYECECHFFTKQF